MAMNICSVLVSLMCFLVQVVDLIVFRHMLFLSQHKILSEETELMGRLVDMSKESMVYVSEAFAFLHDRNPFLSGLQRS